MRHVITGRKSRRVRVFTGHAIAYVSTMGGFRPSDYRHLRMMPPELTGPWYGYVSQRTQARKRGRLCGF